MVKKWLGVFSLILIGMFVSGQPLHVMTYNIRLDTPDDGPDQWKYRKENLAGIIQYFEADICGMQEALYHQIQDLEKLLPGYTFAGKGRDDGKYGGEFSPVFFRKERFDYLEGNTFWLSETPEKPSKSWDAALNRIVTWLKLKDKRTGKTFFVFNTHFDHIGKVARKESARLLVKKIKETAGNHPVILTGDLNTTPDDEPYSILTALLTDSKKISRDKPFGPDSTFNGFKNAEFDGMRIDYILVNPAFAVRSYATISQTWAGRFASDHHPVFIKTVFQ
jgi:endonuclease/exonuclease/phosphatase family metal-dependent hydrolase